MPRCVLPKYGKFLDFNNNAVCQSLISDSDDIAICGGATSCDKIALVEGKKVGEIWR